MKSILKRSSSEVDSKNIIDVKVLSLREVGLDQPPPPPYLSYPPYMYPYSPVPLPPPPVTKPKVKKVTETKIEKEIEKDEKLIDSVAR